MKSLFISQMAHGSAHCPPVNWQPPGTTGPMPNLPWLAMENNGKHIPNITQQHMGSSSNSIHIITSTPESCWTLLFRLMWNIFRGYGGSWLINKGWFFFHRWQQPSKPSGRPVSRHSSENPGRTWWTLDPMSESNQVKLWFKSLFLGYGLQ